MNTHEIFKSSKIDVEREGEVFHGRNLMIWKLWSNLISIWPCHSSGIDLDSSLEYTVTQFEADYSAALIRKLSHLVFCEKWRIVMAINRNVKIRIVHWPIEWPNSRIGYFIWPLNQGPWLFRTSICEKPIHCDPKLVQDFEWCEFSILLVEQCLIQIKKGAWGLNQTIMIHWWLRMGANS